ncbi:MAG: hypothetical protein J2P44_13775 [Candidatus Dormibacteraeota bacterium]|nr:hypothetical protein [Candidatus Dormibacteraeota bacterium]
MGADVDRAAFEDEVRAQVERKLRDGAYPPELLRDVAPDPVRDLVDALRGAAHLSVEPPIRSSRPVLGRLVTVCKSLLANLLRWYSRWLVGQMQTLGSSTVSVLGALEERLREHERRLDELSTRSAFDEGVRLGMPQVIGHVAPGQPATGSGWRAAWRWAVHGRALGAAPGPVAVLGCGAGEFLALLQAAGIECYGVEPHAERVRQCEERGLVVRQEEVLAHLVGVPGGTLGGILLEELPGGLPQSGLAELFRLAAGALTRDGLLVVETDAGTAFQPRPRDVDALENAPLTFFAISAGFADVQVRELSMGPDASRLRPVPVPTGSPLGEVIGALNENLQRMDEALFGPRLLAVVARR